MLDTGIYFNSIIKPELEPRDERSKTLLEKEDKISVI